MTDFETQVKTDTDAILADGDNAADATYSYGGSDTAVTVFVTPETSRQDYDTDGKYIMYERMLYTTTTQITPVIGATITLAGVVYELTDVNKFGFIEMTCQRKERVKAVHENQIKR